MTTIDDFIQQKRDWRRAMIQLGHTPKLSEKTLDIFAYEDGYCNGPACTTCGWSVCWHCSPSIDNIPKCIEARK